MDIEFKINGFEGPLDLLFHLIEKNKIDIYDIPIKELTDQYMEYISDFSNRNMENMSEFLVMAATLIEIKSSMLLPKLKTDDSEEEEEDPREELVRKLVEYKKIKAAAEIFNERQKSVKDYIFKNPDTKLIEKIIEGGAKEISEILDGADLVMLYKTFKDVLKRQDKRRDRIREGFDSIKRDLFTVEDKIQYISDLVFIRKKFRFSEILKKSVSRSEAVVTFLAVLELIKIRKILVKQDNNFEDILISENNGA